MIHTLPHLITIFSHTQRCFTWMLICKQ